MPIVKEHISLVVIGHLDSGKSTLCGNLLYKCGFVDDKTFKKIENETQKWDRISFKYAWIMDKFKYEREHGFNIDISIKSFESPKYKFTIINTPGHKDYIKNMIAGVSQAEVAILTVSSYNNENDDGILKDGLTRQSLVIAFTFGIKQLIICINKIDDKLIEYFEDRYNKIKKDLSTTLSKVGYKPKKIKFIPVSGIMVII